MRVYRMLSLTTLVMLAIAGIVSYHLSYWVLNPDFVRKELFIGIWGASGFGIICGLANIAAAVGGLKSFGSPEFRGELAAAIGTTFAVLAVVGAILVGMFTTGNSHWFAVIMLGTLSGYVLNVLTLILVNANDNWVGQSNNHARVTSISSRERAG